MRKEHPKPWWIWPVSPKVLPYRIKHFYAYFCWFGPNTNYEWNGRLARRFGVSRSTIKRWIKQLVKLRLVWITSGGGPHRRIHTHYYRNIWDWYTMLALGPSKRLRSKIVDEVWEQSRQRQLRSLLF